MAFKSLDLTKAREGIRGPAEIVAYNGNFIKEVDKVPGNDTWFGI